jgi:hypothetical protein
MRKHQTNSNEDLLYKNKKYVEDCIFHVNVIKDKKKKNNLNNYTLFKETKEIKQTGIIHDPRLDLGLQWEICPKGYY